MQAHLQFAHVDPEIQKLQKSLQGEPQEKLLKMPYARLTKKMMNYYTNWTCIGNKDRLTQWTKEKE